MGGQTCTSMPQLNNKEKQVVNDNPPSNEKIEPAATGSKAPAWLIGILAVLALLLIYVAYAQYDAQAKLSAQLSETNKKLDQLTSRASDLEDNYADLKGEFEVTSEKLGLTQQELSRARSLARQIKEDQQRTAAQLGSQIEAQQAQLGSLSGAVSEVKGSVAETREQLEETQHKLQRTIGDMGLQSGLIARNHDELEELKKRGERDYFEFNIRKSKQYTRVGIVSVRLNKTDTKRQRFTMTLLESDKRIEKKDKTLLEPVQFYLPGTRHLLELVVFEINKDHIAGYLSVPKEAATARR
jgi:chromosome segregation ATPase